MCGAGGAPVRRRDRHRRRRRGRRAGQDVRLGTLARMIRAPSSGPTRSNPLREGCRDGVSGRFSREGTGGAARASGTHVNAHAAPRHRPSRRPRGRRLFRDRIGRRRVAGHGRSHRAPTAAPTVVEGIAHPTGAVEIVLRLDESGGFVPAEFLAAHVPQFTLYGDGTVVYRERRTRSLPERNDGVDHRPARQDGNATEAQVQDLLEYALRDGGLGAARADYQNPLVADAPTAVFTINADGATKTVSVVALGMEDPQPNAGHGDQAGPRRARQPAARLRRGRVTRGDAVRGGRVRRRCSPTQEGLEGVQFRDWPWTTSTPADFTVPNDPNVLPQGRATLTPEQAAALGVDGLRERDRRRRLPARRRREDLHVRAPPGAPRRRRVARRAGSPAIS